MRSVAPVFDFNCIQFRGLGFIMGVGVWRIGYMGVMMDKNMEASIL